MLSFTLQKNEVWSCLLCLIGFVTDLVLGIQTLCCMTNCVICITKCLVCCWWGYIEVLKWKCYQIAAFYRYINHRHIRIYLSTFTYTYQAKTSTYLSLFGAGWYHPVSSQASDMPVPWSIFCCNYPTWINFSMEVERHQVDKVTKRTRLAPK